MIRNYIIGLGILIFLGYIFYNIVLYPVLFPMNKELKTTITENTFEVIDLDINSNSIDEYEFLDEIIGSSRIVMLGEQCHGDAPTFLIKTKIVKYLHQKLNFDVLVFESDFYGLLRTWDQIEQNRLPLSKYKDNIYRNWTYCQEFNGLFEYIDSCFYTSNRLDISGVDPRQVLNYSSENFVQELEKEIVKQQVWDNETISFFLGIVAELTAKEYQIEIPEKHQERFLSLISDLKHQFNNGSFWGQEVKNLEGFAKNTFDPLESHRFRDIQMADNLLWLYNKKYKGKKLIVWGHNLHIAKNFQNLRYNYNKDSINMGTVLKNKITDENLMYVMGFGSHSGRYGTIYDQKQPIHKSPPHYFDHWIHALDYDYAYTDFRSISFSDRYEVFFMKSPDHFPVKADWLNIYDGFFFIDSMFPCGIKNAEKQD